MPTSRLDCKAEASGITAAYRLEFHQSISTRTPLKNILCIEEDRLNLDLRIT